MPEGDESLPAMSATSQRRAVPTTPRWLRNTFLATDVSVQVDGEWLEAEVAARTLSRPLFVITAWNPYSDRRSVKTNAAANRSLQKMLLEEGATLNPALGSDADNEWAEESFAVQGLGRKKARGIGRKFGQHAIFELTLEEQVVLGCTGDWSERRLYGPWSPSPQSSEDLPSVIKRVTGVEVSSRHLWAAELGWEHSDGLGAPCPACGFDLELFGCDLEAKDGRPYRAMAFTCAAEGRLLLSYQVDKVVRAVARTRWQYLQARSDADCRGRSERTHWAYCIELDDGVGKRPPGHPWIYVGQTSTNPEKRFDQHLSGHRSSPKVRRHGLHLRPDLYLNQPNLRTKTEAETYEAWLAESLRSRGWPVKGGH